MNRSYFIILVIAAVIGCNGKPWKRSGRITIELVVYNDPTGDLYNSVKIPVSTLYFLRNAFIEELPAYVDSTANGMKYLFIRNGTFARLSKLDEIADPELVFHPLTEKDMGIRFPHGKGPDYGGRLNLPDTAFGGHLYRRIAVPSDSAYTVFYIHPTDTILPFSLNPQFDREYNGILHRIDTYEYRSNRFLSLRLLLSDTIPETVYNALRSVKAN